MRLLRNNSLRLVMTILGLGALYVLVLNVVLNWPIPDAMMSYAGWSFAIALTPAIRENFREGTAWNRTSSLSTFTLLVILTLGMFLIGATLTAVSEIFVTAAWGVLAFQGFLYGGDNEDDG